MSSSSYSKARCIDDLALVKATAWAKWCEEFDLSTNYNKVQQQPSSRYNLQLIFDDFDTRRLTFLKSSSSIDTDSSNKNNNNNIALLDKYEIERITSQLDEYIENSKEKITSTRENKKMNIFKGFLLFKYYKMMMMKMCVTSSYDDVVVVMEERRVLSNPHSPEKSPAVKFATCRPRRKHV